MNIAEAYGQYVVIPLMNILPNSILQRALLGGGLAAILTYIFRPAVSYNPDGSWRPWGPMPFLYPAAGPPTIFPWFAWAVAGALILSLIV